MLRQCKSIKLTSTAIHVSHISTRGRDTWVDNFVSEEWVRMSVPRKLAFFTLTNVLKNELASAEVKLQHRSFVVILTATP